MQGFDINFSKGKALHIYQIDDDSHNESKNVAASISVTPSRRIESRRMFRRMGKLQRLDKSEHSIFFEDISESGIGGIVEMPMKIGEKVLITVSADQGYGGGGF